MVSVSVPVTDIDRASDFGVGLPWPECERTRDRFRAGTYSVRIRFRAQTVRFRKHGFGIGRIVEQRKVAPCLPRVPDTRPVRR